MRIPFIKMHGCGNDFVVLDGRGGVSVSADQAAAIADRRRGVGCDQVIILEPADDADVFMRIRNPDGGEAGACGNATRCVAQLMADETGSAAFAIRTIAGVLLSEVLADGRVQVDMGPPGLDWRDVPLACAMDTLHLDLEGDPAACSMGNPHATWFSAEDPTAFGPAREHDALFPDRANIGFADIVAPDRIRLRVWERGAGLTLACGSGACAALVNAARRGLTGRRAEIVMDGGTLDVAWREDGHVLMTGPVATSFHGTLDL